MSYIYLASPYSAETPEKETENFLQAERATAWLIRNAMWTFSPIVHCHHMALNYEFSRTFSFWRCYNRAMLQGASKFFILEIPGWQESKGVAAELDMAESMSHIKTMGLVTPLDNNEYHVCYNPIRI